MKQSWDRGKGVQDERIKGVVTAAFEVEKLAVLPEDFGQGLGPTLVPAFRFANEQDIFSLHTAKRSTQDEGKAWRCMTIWYTSDCKRLSRSQRLFRRRGGSTLRSGARTLQARCVEVETRDGGVQVGLSDHFAGRARSWPRCQRYGRRGRHGRRPQRPRE